jgi:hypothetical protein
MVVHPKGVGQAHAAAGVAARLDEESLSQFFRQMVPDTGPIDGQLLVDGASAVFDRIGDGILVTHSHAGGFAWHATMKNRGIKAVVSLEPGSGFVFPQGEVPAPMPSSSGTLSGEAVPLADFLRLTDVPIVVYYGDNIPTVPTEIAEHIAGFLKSRRLD